MIGQKKAYSIKQETWCGVLMDPRWNKTKISVFWRYCPAFQSEVRIQGAIKALESHRTSSTEVWESKWNRQRLAWGNGVSIVWVSQTIRVPNMPRVRVEPACYISFMETHTLRWEHLCTNGKRYIGKICHEPVTKNAHPALNGTSSEVLSLRKKSWKWL